MQQGLCKLLNDHPYFSGQPAIKAIPRSQGDVISAVEEARASIGIVVIIGPAGGRFIHHDMPGPQLDGAFTVTVIENPAQNRGKGGTNQPAEAVAWAASMLLKHSIPLHPEDGTSLIGGVLIPEEIKDAMLKEGNGDTTFVSEFTVKGTGGNPRNFTPANLARI